MKSIFEDTVEAVYMDNAATTMMDDEVVDAMMPFLQERYGNPASPHHLGRDADDAVEKARESVSELLGADSGEIVFTSGGTESNNWAIKCAGITEHNAIQNLGRIAVCSAIEHSSVLESVRDSIGGLTISVDAFGNVDLNELETIISSSDVRIVSIQHCNNEIGTIQDIPAIARLCHEHGALLHVDAVQSFGKWQWDVDDLGADLVSVSAHKIHGPMGVGALYIKEGTPIEPFFHGGGQERKRRAGTLAVPNIVGFGKACDMAWSGIRNEPQRQKQLLDNFMTEMSVRHGFTRNGDADNTAPHILSVLIPVEGLMTAAVLSSNFGICVGTGSACSSKMKESHVLTAIGMPLSKQENVLRISISRFNNKKHLDMLRVALDRAIYEASKRSLI